MEEQLAALRSLDGQRAYAAAAPNVLRKFPSVDTFMAMVRRAYTPLLAAKNLQFGLVRGASSTVTQGATYSEGVDFFDASSGAWTAVFGLERQADGSLKITSCVLIPRQPNAV